MKCPGQDTKFWKAGDIFEVNCPKCKHGVEFFKDDTSRKCENCGHRFVNPNMDFGCAAYCQFAEQCIGDLPPELLAQKQDLLKDRVAVEMKRIFKNDFDRIGHATRVARYAERIGKAEGGNLVVILSAAYLQDIDAYEARRKHGRHATQQLKSECPSTAKSILTKLGADEKIIAEVTAIIAEDSSRSHQSVNDQVVHDANMLEKLVQNQKQETLDAEMLSERIEASFLTDSGRELASEMLLKSQ